MSNKKILVTGAEGFIGSHLTETLVRAGNSVKALVLYNSFGSWGWLDTLDNSIKKNIEVVLGDVRDPFSTNKAVEKTDIVFHLAALIAIPYSYSAPKSYIDTNIEGTVNVLQAATMHGISKVIHTSTSEVYGTAQFVPITEEHPLNAQSPYAATKIAADQMALAYHRSFGTPVTIARPFNTYGPRQSARAVIPTIITQIAKGAKSIKLGNLTATRDFNYVADTVSGFISLAESDKSIGQVFNFGSNFEISIGDTVSLISNLMNRHIEIDIEEARLRPENSEVERLCADNSKALKVIGWKPGSAGIDGLEHGLRKTIAWFQDSSNLALYKTDIFNV